MLYRNHLLNGFLYIIISNSSLTWDCDIFLYPLWQFRVWCCKIMHNRKTVELEVGTTTALLAINEFSVGTEVMVPWSFCIAVMELCDGGMRAYVCLLCTIPHSINCSVVDTIRHVLWDVMIHIRLLYWVCLSLMSMGRPSLQVWLFQLYLTPRWNYVAYNLCIEWAQFNNFLHNQQLFFLTGSPNFPSP